MSGLVTGDEDEGLIDSSHNFPTLQCCNVLSKYTQAYVLNTCVRNHNNNMQCQINLASNLSHNILWRCYDIQVPPSSVDRAPVFSSEDQRFEPRYDDLVSPWLKCHKKHRRADRGLGPCGLIKGGVTLSNGASRENVLSFTGERTHVPKNCKLPSQIMFRPHQGIQIELTPLITPLKG